MGIEQILHSFPSVYRKDVEEVLHILPLETGIRLANGQVHNVTSLVYPDGLTFTFKAEPLIIPYRVYLHEPRLELVRGLSNVQHTILHCIYLRHHDGFIRQRHLKQLIDNTADFIVPFTLQLLGEYVMEILEVLDKHINDTTIDHYVSYINENPKYWQQTESRMISYWNEYYRWRIPNLNDYIGEKIVERLKRRRTTLALYNMGF